MSRSFHSTLFLTALAMLAFAANSVLARLALLEDGADPLAFTAIRLISGAVFLTVIMAVKKRKAFSENNAGLWNAAALFLYALAFSLSYVSLGAGMGALLLFASVQISIVGIGLIKGQKFNTFEWLGVGAALGGLVYLFLPGLKAPPVAGSVLMILAGIAWGVYTYLGKSAKSPALMTTRSFQIAAIPGVLYLGLVPFLGLALNLDANILTLGIISGAITSGLGYIIWYWVVTRLRVSVISTVQLSVPLIAMLGGILFIGEGVNARLVIASILILGGIFLTARGQTRNS